uniref:Uncharacterized protein n=1 Tax=Heterorhabditis bacteriophora TaxID=37862 RepID=A0A1I7WZH3_HETBA
MCIFLTVDAFTVLVRSSKMGELRSNNLNTIVRCFKEYSKQFRNKRVFASTSGNVAKLFDENGAEFDCSRHAEETNHKYDQHCFFSPLNCFFSKIKLNKQTKF